MKEKIKNAQQFMNKIFDYMDPTNPHTLVNFMGILFHELGNDFIARFSLEKKVVSDEEFQIIVKNVLNRYTQCLNQITSSSESNDLSVDIEENSSSYSTGM